MPSSNASVRVPTPGYRSTRCSAPRPRAVCGHQSRSSASHQPRPVEAPLRLLVDQAIRRRRLAGAQVQVWRLAALRARERRKPGRAATGCRASWACFCPASGSVNGYSTAAARPRCSRAICRRLWRSRAPSRARPRIGMTLDPVSFLNFARRAWRWRERCRRGNGLGRHIRLDRALDYSSSGDQLA